MTFQNVFRLRFRRSSILPHIVPAYFRQTGHVTSYTLCHFSIAIFLFCTIVGVMEKVMEKVMQTLLIEEQSSGLLYFTSFIHINASALVSYSSHQHSSPVLLQRHQKLLPRITRSPPAALRPLRCFIVHLFTCASFSSNPVTSLDFSFLSFPHCNSSWNSGVLFSWKMLNLRGWESFKDIWQ